MAGMVLDGTHIDCAWAARRLFRRSLVASAAVVVGTKVKGFKSIGQDVRLHDDVEGYDAGRQYR